MIQHCFHLQRSTFNHNIICNTTEPQRDKTDMRLKLISHPSTARITLSERKSTTWVFSCGRICIIHLRSIFTQESAVIEAAGPKLTFSSQNAFSLQSRAPAGGSVSIAGLSRGGDVCRVRAQVSTERWHAAGGAWLTVSPLVSLYELCQQWAQGPRRLSDEPC